MGGSTIPGMTGRTTGKDGGMELGKHGLERYFAEREVDQETDEGAEVVAALFDVSTGTIQGRKVA